MKYKIYESLFWLLHCKIKDKEKIGGEDHPFLRAVLGFFEHLNSVWSLHGVYHSSQAFKHWKLV